jgi:gamma-glutamyltranspeptidase
MPLPDPAQQGTATAQVNAALEAYRALQSPPADVVDLANKVSTHLQSNAYKRSVEARAAYQAGDTAFLADPTITLPQLIAQVRALTAQLAVVRDA